MLPFTGTRKKACQSSNLGGFYFEISYIVLKTLYLLPPVEMAQSLYQFACALIDIDKTGTVWISLYIPPNIDSGKWLIGKTLPYNCPVCPM